MTFKAVWDGGFARVNPLTLLETVFACARMGRYGWRKNCARRTLKGKKFGKLSCLEYRIGIVETFYRHIERYRESQSPALALFVGLAYVIGGLIVFVGHGWIVIYLLLGFPFFYTFLDEFRPIIRSIEVDTTEIRTGIGQLQFFRWPSPRFYCYKFLIKVSTVKEIRKLDFCQLPWYPRRWFSHANAYLMYPLNGTDGLEITSHSGYKWYVNTDDPEGLEHAIRHVLEARGQKVA